MPRDTVALLDAPVRHPEEIAILDKMAELLATPERWCQGVSSEHRYGGWAHCVLGALRFVDDKYVWGLDVLSLTGLAVSSRLRIGTQIPIDSWNDAPERTHADILALIAGARRSFE